MSERILICDRMIMEIDAGKQEKAISGWKLTKRHRLFFRRKQTLCIKNHQLQTSCFLQMNLDVGQSGRGHTGNPPCLAQRMRTDTV